MQHRGRMLRLEPGAHPPDRRDREPTTTSEVTAQLPSAPRVLTALPLAIDPGDVLRLQGYKASVDTPGPEVLALFEDALALGRASSPPAPSSAGWAGPGRAPAPTAPAASPLPSPDSGPSWG